MKDFLKRLRFPLVSLGFCILAYGLLIPWHGLYWDDWPYAWFAHQFGPGFFIGYAPHRPASGYLYALWFSLLGESILAWQLVALFWRWISMLALWGLLRRLWPETKSRWIEVAVLVFGLYPGFSQQPVAMAYSVYFFYYTLFIGSLWLMLAAAQSSGRRRVWMVLGALALQAATMLSTEYLYGLEGLRPLLLWLGLGLAGWPDRKQLSRILRQWSPYLLLAIAILAWRYRVSQLPGYQYGTPFIGDLAAQPLQSVWDLVPTILGDYWESAILVWGRLVTAWSSLQFQSLASLAYLGVTALALALGGWALKPRSEKTSQRSPGTNGALWLGPAALLIGGLPFWIAELPLRLDFPWDRLTLPMAFGIALLVGWSYQRLPLAPRLKLAVIALILALAVGFQFDTANNYREDWEQQRSFFQQMQWRIPSLKPGTALLTTELPLAYYTDNSLTAPLNWIYDHNNDDVPYFMAYLDLRTDPEIFAADTQTIVKSQRSKTFEGLNTEVVLFYYSPPACLRVLDPGLYRDYPQLPAALADHPHPTDYARILPEPTPTGDFPYWTADADEDSWCYYFEKADLARQLGDWQQVAALGDKAFTLEDSANFAAEWLPFIEGYAKMNNWDRALELTRQTVNTNDFTQPQLCTLWERIAAETEPSGPRQAALDEAEALLACQSTP